MRVYVCETIHTPTYTHGSRFRFHSHYVAAVFRVRVVGGQLRQLRVDGEVLVGGVDVDPGSVQRRVRADDAARHHQVVDSLLQRNLVDAVEQRLSCRQSPS